MLILSNILILSGSLGIIYEDWKSFEIHLGWYLLLLMGILGFTYWYFEPIGFKFFWPFLFINLILLGGTLGFVSIWVSIKNKRLINIFTAHFGLGDFLSLMLFSIWFPPIYFIGILVCSSLIGVFIEQFRQTKKIPLASYLGICSLIVHVFLISPINQ